MSDRIEKLRATLRELETELAEIDTLDDETRAELELAREEIEAALESRAASARSNKGDQWREPTGAIERLRAATRDFEAEHPTLAAIVHRTIDGLGQLGI
jgi:hypothetical protein